MSTCSSKAGLLVGLAASLAAALASGGPARAADLDYGYASIPRPIAESKVEFGSGWYVRGDIGASRMPTLHLTNPSIPSELDPTPPAAPGVSIGSGNNIGFVASLAGGYQFNHYLRGDLMFDYHQPVVSNGTSGNANVFCVTGVSYPNEVVRPTGGINYGAPSYANGGCTGNYESKINSYDVLVNAYIDLGTWYRVTPYVGAGVGLSFGHYQSQATYTQANGVPYHISYNDPQFGSFSPNFDRTSSGNYYNLAFAAMAGIAIDVYDHTKLDIGYRYLNLGRIASLNGSLERQEVRAGLRYMIDN